MCNAQMREKRVEKEGGSEIGGKKKGWREIGKYKRWERT